MSCYASHFAGRRLEEKCKCFFYSSPTATEPFGFLSSLILNQVK